MKDLIQRAKQRLLQMHYEAGVGHIGGNLSCLDTLMVLYHKILQPHDVFILSKGHAAGALYVTLWSKGLLTDDDLRTFHKDGTRLAGHPIPNAIPGIPFATGSLGHGLPVATGWALGKQLQRQPGRVFVLISDGEWQEGSNWEASLFLQRHPSLPLMIMTDKNDLQGMCPTLNDLSDLSMDLMPPAFWYNGHDVDQLERALTGWDSRLQSIMLQTVKGHGVSFMENQVAWHYLPMNVAQYTQACAENGGSVA